MFSEEHILRWVLAFALTQAVEVPIYKRMLGVGIGRAFAASSITHPVVWFGFPVITMRLYVVLIYPWLGPGAVAGIVIQTLYLLLAESFAIGVETAFFRWSGVERAFRAALVANVASVIVGGAVQLLTGWP
jgi:hypothetical protein